MYPESFAADDGMTKWRNKQKSTVTFNFTLERVYVAFYACPNNISQLHPGGCTYTQDGNLFIDKEDKDSLFVFWVKEESKDDLWIHCG